jgi:hypothetical protein
MLENNILFINFLSKYSDTQLKTPTKQIIEKMSFFMLLRAGLSNQIADSMKGLDCLRKKSKRMALIPITR